MTQATPPGDNVPLYDGLGPEWNDIVGAFPEDKRNELAPMLKSRLDQYEPLKQWEDFSKSGVTADDARNALSLMSIIENNPRQVYDTLATHLNITPQQAQQVVQDIQDGDEDDPRIATMQQQLNTLSQITLAQRQEEIKQQQQAEADAELDKELRDLKKKYGDDIDEDEVMMRWMWNNTKHGTNTPLEQAYLDYTNKVTKMRTSRPAPMIMGGGGAVPARGIDVTKLDSGGTKNLVAQMLQHAINQQNQ